MTGTDSLFLWIDRGAGGNRDAPAEGASHCAVGVRSETAAALRRLLSSGDYEDRLVDDVLRQGGSEALAELYYRLDQLSRCGLLRRSVCLNGDRLATLVPISRYFAYPSRRLEPASAYRLSRFACMRVDAGQTVLESPTSHARIILDHAMAATIVHALAQPWTEDQLAQQLGPASVQLMTLLLNAGMLTVQVDGSAWSEDQDPSLRSWEFHDLIFHGRSRIGRHDQAVGASFRFVGTLEQPPALTAAASDDPVDLFRPDLERLKREDPPLALVQETRRSIREYGSAPITRCELGEFLYRVARVTRVDRVEMETSKGPIVMDAAFRPYPAGGALYELEIYVGVKACESLRPGLYRYLPLTHQLESRSDLTPDIERLFADAGRATRIPADRLQTLLILSARFQRMSWKYSSIAYAATLKHVGVVFQTMYLVATAMRLAPCAIGSGDSDLFARAAGTKYYEETSVGEFLLGSRALD